MLGCGGAGPAGGIAAGRSHRDTGFPDDGQRHGMVGAPHAYCLQPAGGAQGHDVAAGQDHGQRSRPEALRQGVSHRRNVMAVQLQPVRTGDMEDQGIVLRTALCLKNMEDRCLVKGVGAQSIYRFGRDPQQPAVAENGSCLLNGGVVCLRVEYDRFQSNFFFLKPKVS